MDVGKVAEKVMKNVSRLGSRHRGFSGLSGISGIGGIGGQQRAAQSRIADCRVGVTRGIADQVIAVQLPALFR